MKRITKRIFAAVLSACMLFTLASCNTAKDISTQEPKDVLKTGLDRLEVVADTLQLPDLSQYAGEKTFHELELGLVNSNDYSLAALAGAKANLSAAMDSAGKQLFMNLDLSAQGLSISGNQIYVSPEMIGVAIPMLFQNSTMLTINPQTIVEDWNSSTMGYSAPITAVESTQELMGMIDEMFEASAAADTMPQLDNPFVDITSDYPVTKGEEYSKEINGKSQKLVDFSITIPQADFTAAYEAGVDAVMEYYNSSFNAFSSYMSAADVSDVAGMLAEMETQMKDSISFTKDIEIVYAINENNDIVSIHLPELLMTYEDAYTLEDLSIDAMLTYCGTENLHASWNLELKATDAVETFTMVMNFNDKSTKKLVDVSFDLAVYDEDMQPVDFEMSGSFAWDPSKSEDNLSFDFSMVADYETITFHGNGLMQDNKDEFVLDLKSLSVDTGYTNVELSLLYRLRAATDADFNIDLNNTRSFFDLSDSELMQMLYAFM